MSAIMAPQFLRDSAGRLSTKRMTIVGFLTLLVLYLVAAGSGTPVTLPKRSISDEQLMATIHNSTLGFQKIFVVNLKSRSDRRDGMGLAAAVTNLTFDFVEAATDVSRRALPPNPASDRDKTYGAAHLGSWRSHLNVAQKMVEENIQSALILEDDVDWDIRIKDQLTEFAKGSRVLVQPKPLTETEFNDPTITLPPTEDQAPQLLIAGGHYITKPKISAYGDLHRWDMLWLGHCGANVPHNSDGIPTGQAHIFNDTTVPQQHYIDGGFSTDESYKKTWPSHTRIVFRSAGNVCCLAYALSQQGARRIIYEMGIREMTSTADGGFDMFCRGADGRPRRTCITSLPEYFQHHRPAGVVAHATDISEDWTDTGFNEHAYTPNIRLSTRLNIPNILDGLPLQDRYPDKDIGTDSDGEE